MAFAILISSSFISKSPSSALPRFRPSVLLLVVATAAAESLHPPRALRTSYASRKHTSRHPRAAQSYRAITLLEASSSRVLSIRPKLSLECSAYRVRARDARIRVMHARPENMSNLDTTQLHQYGSN
ncbi:hypothetical protein PSPO01_16362 [Paraphaeosphaeria sporulosa]